jgi:hypothetical protein
MAGKNPNGGSANAPRAPEPKPMARARQPEDRMIASMKRKTRLSSYSAAAIVRIRGRGVLNG